MQTGHRRVGIHEGAGGLGLIAVPEVGLHRIEEACHVGRGIRIEPGRQLIQRPGRRHGVEPVDDQGDGAGGEEGIPHQGVLVALPIVEVDAEHDDEGEVEPEVHDVGRLGQELPVLDPDVHIVFPEDPQVALGIDHVQGVAVSGLRAVDNGAANREVEEEGHSHDQGFHQVAAAEHAQKPAPQGPVAPGGVSLRHGSHGGKAPVHSQPRHHEGSAT